MENITSERGTVLQISFLQPNSAPELNSENSPLQFPVAEALFANFAFFPLHEQISASRCDILHLFIASKTALDSLLSSKNRLNFVSFLQSLDSQKKRFIFCAPGEATAALVQQKMPEVMRILGSQSWAVKTSLAKKGLEAYIQQLSKTSLPLQLETTGLVIFGERQGAGSSVGKRETLCAEAKSLQIFHAPVYELFAVPNLEEKLYALFIEKLFPLKGKLTVEIGAYKTGNIFCAAFKKVILKMLADFATCDAALHLVSIKATQKSAESTACELNAWLQDRKFVS